MDEAETSETGGRPRLSRGRIVDAALAVIDDEGLPALNMRRLGAALGVEAMAIYKHFPNKAAILDAVVAAVLAGLDESVCETDWREGFRATFRAIRAALRAHPNTLPLVASRPFASPRLMKRLRATEALLSRASLPDDDVLHLLHAGLGLTLGYLWLEAGGFVSELPNEAPFLRARAQDVGDETGRASGLVSGWSAEEDFAAGLELLLDGPSGGEGARGPAPATAG